MGGSQSIFSDFLSAMGLLTTLSLETEYTLLAPLNSAFTSEFKLFFNIKKTFTHTHSGTNSVFKQTGQTVKKCVYVSNI